MAGERSDIPQNPIRPISHEVSSEASILFRNFAQGIRERARIPGTTAPEKRKISYAVHTYQSEVPLREDTGNTGVKYLTAGEGDKTLVVLPGITESPYSSVPMLELQHLGYRVVIPDYTTFTYPSLATRGDPTSPKILEEFRANMDAFLSQFSGDVTLMGTSLGGLLSLYYASQTQAVTINRKVLMQTAALGAPAFSERFLSMAAKVGKRISGTILRRGFNVGYVSDRIISEDMMDNEVVGAFLHYAIKDHQRTMSARQAEAYRRLGLAIAHIPQGEAAEMMANISPVDTLIITNEQDVVFPPTKSWPAHYLPHAEWFRLNSRHGHRSTRWDVEEIFQGVVPFLQQAQ